MIKRLKAGLTEPKQLSQFVYDKLRYVFLYILFLSLVVSIPTFIKTNLQQGMDRQNKDNLINALYSKNPTNSIVDYKLIGDINDGIIFDDNQFIGFKASETVIGILYNFTETTLDFYYGPVLVSSHSYTDLGLDSINFSMRSNEDKDKLSEALNIVHNDSKDYLIVVSTISAVMSELVLGLLLILIMTGMSSSNVPKLKMKYRFVLSSYAFTIYYILTFIGILYGLSFLRFIGIIVAQMFMSKGYGQLVQITNINIKGELRE